MTRYQLGNNNYNCNSNSNSTVPNTNILGVENRIYECGYCKKEEEVLVIPWEIFSEWLYISHLVGKDEWGGVFDVVETEGRMTLTNWRMPKQEKKPVSVTFLEELGGNGMVHSHHDMGHYHSGQDDKQARNLMEYSIVLSHTGYTACRKKVLPCGGYGYIDVKIALLGAPITESSLEELFVEEEEVKREVSYYSNWRDTAYSKWEEDNFMVIEDEEEGKAEEFNDKIDEMMDDPDEPCYTCIDFDCQRCPVAEEMERRLK